MNLDEINKISKYLPNSIDENGNLNQRTEEN